LSDAVIVALIAAAPGVVASIVGVLNNTMGRRNAIKLAETTHAISTLEKNTNSIKDALVKVTGEAERAKGVIEGRAEKNK
jgi:hypothetical protein